MDGRITKMKIENFQAHKSLEVDFSSRITTITGPSDRGKSAIIRALIWVMTNKPNGDEFIRYGTDECSVTIFIDDHIIQRIKGKKRNLYILDGIEYKAIKTDVPDDIAKIFNINQNNIQQQFDNIFWFSQTAGEVGRNLNSIVDLDIIDYVMSDIISRSNSAKSKNNALEELIVKQEKELEDADQIELLKNMVDREEKLETNLSQKNARIIVLENILEEAESNEAFITKAISIESMEERLKGNIEKYLINKEKIEKLEKYIDDISDIKVPKEIPENLFIAIQKFEEQNKIIIDKRKNYKSLDDIIINLENVEDDILHGQKILKDLEQKFHNLTDNQICPLCGNTFK